MDQSVVSVNCICANMRGGENQGAPRSPGQRPRLLTWAPMRGTAANLRLTPGERVVHARHH